MQIKIFSGEKAIYLTDHLSGKLKERSADADVIFYDTHQTVNAIALVENLKDEKKAEAIIVTKDFEAAKTAFFDQFELIEAAGGVVQNDDKEILFIYRRGKWDLPKGKMEHGESEELCAEREIEEETGVKGLKLKKKIGETYHIYREKERDILKTSHWFYFLCSGAQVLAPQEAEDITEAKWIKTKHIKEPMDDTYENIREVMRAFFDTP